MSRQMSSLTSAVSGGSLSDIERLPSEILREILSSLFTLSPPSNVDSSDYFTNTLPKDPNSVKNWNERKGSLFSCLLTSRTLHTAALPVLYRDITLSKHSTTLALANQLRRNSYIGRLVHNLDISTLEFQDQNQETIPQLMHCLSQLPLLETLHGPGASNELLDSQLLDLVFRGRFPRLKSLEWAFCPIAEHVLEELTAIPATMLSLVRRVKLRGGDGNLTSIFERLLSLTPRIQHLDISATTINVDVLSAIPRTAKLTHLILSPSEGLANVLMEFLRSHPETRSSLQVLHFRGQPNGPRNEDGDRDDITSLLPLLPTTLKSLDLSPFPTSPSQLSSLPTTISELKIGPDLPFHELEKLLLPDLDNEPDPDAEAPRAESKFNAVLAPITDAVAICKLRRRVNFVPPHSRRRFERLRYLDISAMETSEQRKIMGSVVLGAGSGVGIVEVGEGVYLEGSARMRRVVGSVGWKVRWREGRCWVERQEG